MIRIGVLLWLAAAVIVAVGLYHVKYEVQRLERELELVNAEIREHRNAIHVLGAEWSYLTRPDRLARLAQRHLEWQPARPVTVAYIEQLPHRFDALPPLPLPGGPQDAPIQVNPKPEQNRPALASAQALPQ